MGKRFLIVNADDFGMSPGISRGIIHSIKNGIVSSTSVVVESSYLRDTVELVKSNRDIDWGLHIVIEEENKSSVETFLASSNKQLKKFRHVFGIKPSHIDFHKGFKFSNKVYFAARMMALKNKIGFRYDNKHVIITQFYGFPEMKDDDDAVSKEALRKILINLNSGVSELVCHPGKTGNRLNDPYRKHRYLEFKSLTDKEIVELVDKNGIKIINYKEYEKISNLH